MTGLASDGGQRKEKDEVRKKPLFDSFVNITYMYDMLTVSSVLILECR